MGTTTRALMPALAALLGVLALPAATGAASSPSGIGRMTVTPDDRHRGLDGQRAHVHVHRRLVAAQGPDDRRRPARLDVPAAHELRGSRPRRAQARDLRPRDEDRVGQGAADHDHDRLRPPPELPAALPQGDRARDRRGRLHLPRAHAARPRAGTRRSSSRSGAGSSRSSGSAAGSPPRCSSA